MRRKCFIVFSYSQVLPIVHTRASGDRRVEGYDWKAVPLFSNDGDL